MGWQTIPDLHNRFILDTKMNMPRSKALKIVRVAVLVLLAMIAIDWFLEHHSITRMRSHAQEKFEEVAVEWDMNPRAFAGPELDLSDSESVRFTFESKNFEIDSVRITVRLYPSKFLFPYLSPAGATGSDPGPASEKYRSREWIWPYDSLPSGVSPFDIKRAE